ncbi:MAG: triose-phosphate isomerase [Bacteroidales bacterium]|nr:triose-phosphate isomerase [Bacteroidales bacterium]
MRKKIVAGNWKMNMNYEEGINLLNQIIAKIKQDNSYSKKEYLNVVIAPPFILLKECFNLSAWLDRFYTGAQNCHYADKGAYTGEISVDMIKSTGARYIIVGHSERRSYFNESNSMLKEKVKSILKADMVPIYCCGENLEQRQIGKQFDIVKQQLEEGLFTLEEHHFTKLVIAYEPVWAIGTGLNATPEQAQEMHLFIRNLIKERYNINTANSTSILYGGSCNATNAATLFTQTDVDGGLIGGAALKANDFFTIINSIP